MICKLDAGGMGTVFHAEDTNGRAVAIKLLHPELAQEPEMHRRFRREASILQSLHHPGIVQVLDVGVDAHGHSYTVMELLAGETLHARIRRSPLDPDELRGILSGICDALGAAHAHGVIHGDLKPANVFLLAQGGSKLVDFGTSKVHGLERLTRTGEVIGTPLYMAPEVLTGDGEIDERIDTYSLGVLVYEALSGRTPFKERHPGKLVYQIVLGRGEPLAVLRPDLSPAIVGFVQQAMAPKRESRFASAEALLRAWEQAIGS